MAVHLDTNLFKRSILRLTGRFQKPLIRGFEQSELEPLAVAVAVAVPQQPHLQRGPVAAAVAVGDTPKDSLTTSRHWVHLSP
jgi:hypothetical protein